MISANGKLQIKRYMAGQISEIASHIALGTSSATESVNDTRLGFEVVRVPIVSVSVDPNSDNIVFRANVTPGSINRAYEVGLWSSSSGDTGRALNVVGSNLPVVWNNGIMTSTNARVNTTALKIDYTASGTTNASLSGFFEDLSRFRDVDSLVVAYHASANLSSVRVRMGTDVNNYFEFILPTHSESGYNVARVARSSATRTGNPDWSLISYLAVRPSATAAGSGSIYIDGIRFESNALDDGNLLVARTVLSTPTAIDSDISSDIEYSIRVDVA